MPCTHATLGGQVEKEKKRTETETDKKEGTSPQLFPSAVSRSSCTRLGLEWERPACQPAQQALLCVHRLQPSGKPFSFGYSGQHAACAGSSHFGDDFNLDLRERERETRTMAEPNPPPASTRAVPFDSCTPAIPPTCIITGEGAGAGAEARGPEGVRVQCT